MTDQPITLTPEEAASLAVLTRNKGVTRANVVSHMSGVGAGILSYYPTVEVSSWPIQNPESAAVIAAGEDAMLAMELAELVVIAPFLVNVCIAHHGPIATDAERAAQLWFKAGQVHTNATKWLALSAFVNGLRARFEDRLAAATSPSEVFIIESETATELGAFRALHDV